MSKKTEEQKAFEKFVVVVLRQEDLFYGWNAIFKSGIYMNAKIKFAFACWQESAIIEKDKHKG